MLSKRKKVITTLPPVFFSVVACKLFYSITERVEILSLLFVPPAEGGGMEVIMKKILSLIISLAMFLSLSITTFASDALAVAQPESVSQENTSNPFISPEAYIKYLESFGNEYSEFLSQFKTLSPEKQQTILDVLSNGGTLDVKLSEPIVTTPSIARTSQLGVYYDADFQLFGITFVTIRLEGRFTRSGTTVKTVEYKNAYIVKNWVPLSGFERTSLDAYVSNGRFYASAAFTAYVGAKIGDNIIGVTPRTFYISMSCNGAGVGTGNAW